LKKHQLNIQKDSKFDCVWRGLFFITPNHLSPTPKPSPIQLKNNDTMKTLLHHSAPFNVHAVEVPEDSFDVKIKFYYQYFAVRYRLPAIKGVTKIGSKCLMFKDFGGRKKYPKELIALGTCSPSVIDFDVEDFLAVGEVDVHIGDGIYEARPRYFNYETETWSCCDQYESFDTLLSSNGLDPNKKYLILKSED